ncbi:MAG: D-aminoacyl-tRNA deacylase [Proteobacteria bacterium]|jgi:D-tyrosyl-tRNA(Tyr) deacylase|nr:D-aminoacyl-tRNA deacylase [Pseudomonadota bacterium]
MRAVVQRVRGARVLVDGVEVGGIGDGLLVYLGIGCGDTDADLGTLAEKIAGLRVFRDGAGAMNLSVVDVGGRALVVSQFTLYGDVRRGKRPSFVAAMEPKSAEEMYVRFVSRLEALGVPCARGAFGAMMDVHSVNDGPVTILIDSKKLF